MELILRKYGNSTVLALPPAVLRPLGLKAGQTMTLHASPDGAITLVPGHRHRLSELLAQCTATAAPPQDLWPWDIGAAQQARTGA